MGATEGAALGVLILLAIPLVGFRLYSCCAGEDGKEGGRVSSSREGKAGGDSSPRKGRKGKKGKDGKSKERRREHDKAALIGNAGRDSNLDEMELDDL